MHFFIFLVQKSFLTKNYFLFTMINLTTRGPLYTCLVFIFNVFHKAIPPLSFIKIEQNGHKDHKLWNIWILSYISCIRKIYRTIIPNRSAYTPFFFNAKQKAITANLQAFLLQDFDNFRLIFIYFSMVILVMVQISQPLSYSSSKFTHPIQRGGFWLLCMEAMAQITND